tara:strand:+ start:624 stop:2762 length:2139 start_codon:yes stop_codon:yes gene_type:complete
MQEKDLDYIQVLKATQEIPFNVGKKLLIDFIIGDESNKSIKKNNLSRLDSFGSLAYDKDELGEIVDNLIMNNLLEFTSVPGNKFWKVLGITNKGTSEINNPTLYKKKLSFKFKERSTVITDQDRILFRQFDFFLNNYDESQKKGITCNKEKILCIAGAGTGKTTVLTKKIEFLLKYKSVDPKKILAITFTRKAKNEMVSRLSKTNSLVNVETFNSFCEKILKSYNHIAYTRNVRVISYSDKIRLTKLALSSLNLSMGMAIDNYFSFGQRRGKTNEELSNIFMNDCFFIIDYYKLKNTEIEDFSINSPDLEEKEKAKMIYNICKELDSSMKRSGYRDFADQLVDTIKLFNNHRELIPSFDHILVDEYQDVNSIQIDLISLLNSKNLFCVGDPRQSIFGWRGSKIQHILNFESKYPGCEIITLTKNYRSTKDIVNFVNKSIITMKLPNLESSNLDKSEIKLLKFDSEDGEFEFVIQRILASEIDRSEIFVLARTNKQLVELSQRLKLRGIKCIIRSDELKRFVSDNEGSVTLATIHAIKGLEAKMVFVVGCTPNNFPCKGSEHPVIDMVKVEEYDKEEEERRLFYVAMSRAKETLYLSYSGNHYTKFINIEMKNLLDIKTPKIEIPKTKNYKLTGASSDLLSKLKDWRRDISTSQNIKPFMVLHDRTLLELIEKSPLDIKDLDTIHGFGPTKIMKYGEDILDMIKSHVTMKKTN